MEHAAFTARCTLCPVPSGSRYTFFCDLTGRPVYTTPPLGEGPAPLAEARRMARPYFNRCARCGRWVCDAAYNIDEVACLGCAPAEGALPGPPPKSA